MQGSSILHLLKSRVQLPTNSELFSLSDLSPLSGGPAPLGMRVEFIPSSSQVNKLKMPSDKHLWFMISCLKKLHYVNHPSSESHISTNGCQQKRMCMSCSDRQKMGKAVMNKTQQEVSKGIKRIAWITCKNWLGEDSSAFIAECWEGGWWRFVKKSFKKINKDKCPLSLLKQEWKYAKWKSGRPGSKQHKILT